MATKPTSIGNYTSISKDSQALVTNLLKDCVGMFGTTYNIRDRMKNIDRNYLRKVDRTKDTAVSRELNKADPTKFQNVVIPVVKPQVETHVSALSSIFLQGIPIFGVSAAPPYQDVAMQIESILKDQEDVGGWSKEFQSCFRDGSKYNLMAAEVAWNREVLPQIKTEITSDNLANSARVVTDAVWEGNAIKRLDLYNSFWDLRCNPNKLHEQGEFAGYNELISRVELVRTMWKLSNTQLNRKAALESLMQFTGESAPGTAAFHIPEINPDAIVENQNTAFNWAVWFGNTATTESGVKLANSYIKTTFYLRLIPEDFKLAVPAPRTPAVWKFIIINGEHIIYAEQLRSAHDYLPIVLANLDCGDLGYQETGLAEEMMPFQSLSSAYANAGVASMRKALNDRMLYDQSKIEKKDIENPNPSAKIPVKSSQMGKPLNEAVFPIPYVDSISGGAMQGVSQIAAFANQASGQNAAAQGQFVKGNKTLHEYADVMNNGNGRNVNTAINVEHNFMKPIKDMLRMNILQFQPSSAIYNQGTNEVVQIDPVALRRAIFKFKMSDGLSPADKVMNADAFGMAFQQIASSPALQAQYDLGGLATFLMKQQRADISIFQKPQSQVAYEQAAAQWQQLAMMALEKGVGLEKLPAQPKPTDFGWDPNVKNNSAPSSDPQGKPGIMQQVVQIAQATEQGQNQNSPNSNPPPQGA